ncbi:flagellar hook-length control protein FliK [Marinobacterium sp. YM272]|uniref:flagellar hook-length control protein FliK n=1 Tax=Marinobacterium sp. YM272 TaxID=3421654 RepID=UPI003D7FBCE4
MPSASVSLSIASVSASVSPSRPAPSAAPGGATPSGGFAEVMRDAQGHQGKAAGKGGDALPSGGKELPAQRQQENLQPEHAGNASVEKAGKDLDQVDQPTAEPEEGESGHEDKALQAQNDGAEEAVTADSQQRLKEPASSAEVPRPGLSVENRVGQSAQSSSKTEAGVEVTVTGDKLAGEGENDPHISGSAQRPGPSAENSVVQPSQDSLTADAAAEGTDSGSKLVVQGESKSESESAPQLSARATGENDQTTQQSARAADRSGVQADAAPAVSSQKSGETAPLSADTAPVKTQPELSEQGARPEVRAAALQNGKPGEVSSGESKPGVRVSELASEGRRTGTRTLQSETVDSASVDSIPRDSGAVDNPEAVVPEAGVVEEEAPMSAATAQLAAQSSTPAVEGQTSAQSARDTVSQSIERNANVAQAGAQSQTGDSAQATAQNARSGGESGGQQNGGQRNAAGELLASQQGQASARGDAESAPGSSRSPTLFSADTRAAGDSASGLNAQGQSQTANGLQTGGAAPRPDAASAAAAMAQRLQDPAWGRAMGQRAIMMAQYGPRTAEIQLDPPELGAMQIRIHLSGSDQVSVSFNSPHAQVRDAIEQQLPRLREMFAEQGMDLSQSSVSDQSARGRGDDSSGGRSSQSASAAYGESGSGDETPVNVTQAPVGLVDYYA